MRFRVTSIMDTAISDKQTMEVHRALCTLADDLNSCLLNFEVTLEHYDTEDFLRFEMDIEAIEEDYRSAEATPQVY